MTLSQNEAYRFISVIDHRIEKALGRGTVLEITYGDVDDVNGREASVFVAGDSTASEGFRIPSGMYLESGYRVRVAIDPRGYRYIEEVLAPTSYSKVAINPVDGTVLFGSGFIEPGQANLYWDLSTNALTTDNIFHAVDGIRVTSPSGINGQNFEAIRIQPPTNGYKALAVYAGPLEDQPVFRAWAWGGLEWGPGGVTEPDTNLYRNGVDLLRTDGAFMADGFVTINPAAGQTNEGGELALNGAGAFADWSIDNLDGRVRFHSGGTVPLEVRTTYVNLTGSLRVDDVQVVSNRRGGWGVPTGTASRATFATNTVLLESLAQRVKALIDDLTAHGLIGA